MPKAIPEGLTADHVILAINDLNNMIEHPFKQAVHYELVYNGKSYPPKAVVGIAFRHLNGTILSPEDFSGGEATGQANSLLRALGFTVSRKSDDRNIGMTRLQLYILRVLSASDAWMTRKEIGAMIRRTLGVTTGYDKGYAEAMGVQSGEPASDSLIGMGYVEHQPSRRTNSRFEYRITPTGRIVVEAYPPQHDALRELAEINVALEEEGYFDPYNLQDERARRLREIAQRKGQEKFRAALLDSFKRRCAVTGCDAVPALEAAHIMPYLGPHSNHVSNGLLLRADIHTLFDLDFIGVEPDSLMVALAEPLQGTCYGELSRRVISIADDASLRPSSEALQERWKRFRASSGQPS